MKSIHINRHEACPLYIQLREKIRKAILGGTLSGRIPSERELAYQYDIAPMTVRQAILDLVDEGLLVRIVGKGTYVCDVTSYITRTNSIAFAISPRILDAADNPYFLSVLQSIEASCRDRNYFVVFASDLSNLLPHAKRYAEANFVCRRVDGVIAAAFDDNKVLREIGRIMPVVILDNRIDGFTSVIADNENGSLLATRHLVELGHKTIGHIGGNIDSPVACDRAAGYRRALEENNLPYDQSLVVYASDFTFYSGYAAAGRLLERFPSLTAIFCANDAMALGAIKRIQELQKHVPKDISVVGFDDIAPARLSDPPLTTVHVPTERIAAIATELLFGMLNQPAQTRIPEVRTVPVNLVERGSTRRLQ